ncbi:hypothetical protein P4131_00020 [Pseudomonas aeruginosa]|nr:hypothetical protein [Pseudomonas aeruginosa]
MIYSLAAGAILSFDRDLLVLDQEGLVEGVDVDFGAGRVFRAGVRVMSGECHLLLLRH